MVWSRVVRRWRASRARSGVTASTPTQRPALGPVVAEVVKMEQVLTAAVNRTGERAESLPWDAAAKDVADGRRTLIGAQRPSRCRRSAKLLAAVRNMASVRERGIAGQVAQKRCARSWLTLVRNARQQVFRSV